MKKLYIMLLAMLSCVVSAYAQSFEVDGISYNVTKQPKGESPGEVEVTSKEGGYEGDIVIPAEVTYGEQAYEVITIGYRAFWGSQLSSVLFGERLTTIGGQAFQFCSNLSSITLPNNVTTIKSDAFGHCDNLTSVILDNQLVSIGMQAFSGCSSLTTITIPESVTSIGENAFRQCSNLTSVLFDNQRTTIEKNAFQYCSNLKDVTIVVRDYSEFCNNPIVGTFGGYNVNNCPIQLLDTDGNEITDYIIPEGVTTIDEKAFRNCSNLTSIIIPNSVTAIGNSAFSGCSGLKMVKSEISVPFDVDAFNSYYANLVVPRGSRADYKSVNGWRFALIFEDGETIYEREQTDEQGIKYTLKQADDFNFYYSVTGHSDEMDAEIVIPAIIGGISVGAVESYAFRDCSSLLSVTIPKSVTSIGNNVFDGCSNLTSVKIGKNVSSIGASAFFNCTSLTSITLPNNLESIGNKAFSGSALTSITIPNRVREIGTSAFQDCKSLTTAIISGSVKTIGGVAFGDCNNLISVSLEDGIISIDDYAFANCNLIAVTIPNSVTKIGTAAFDSNWNLTTVILGDGISEIATHLFWQCSRLTSVIIPDGVTNIGYQAFGRCSSLTSVKLPNSLTSMGEFVFYECPLNSIELPNSFTTIPDELFAGNTNLQYIKLGDNVKSIGKNAFGSSNELLLEIGTSTPPTISKDAFPNIQMLSDINVIVPDAKAETAYRKAAVWQEMTFSNQNNISEVTVETPGDLSFELITQCNMMPAKVVGMKVNGTINADDFNQMLVNMKSLLCLDLSDCNITAIPDNAMKGKMQLKELILPTKLQTIGQSAFQGCTFLSALTMQNGLQTIGKNAFQGCTGLTGELNLPSTLTTIGESAFVGTDYSSVKLPNTLKTIDDYAFYNVPIKQQLTLPKKVTSVGSSAFAGTKITGLEIPDGVTSIGDNAFADTPIEGHVTIPDGVTYLGKGAFRNSQLSTVFLPNSVAELSQGVFQGCPNLDLVYVPDNYTGLSSSVFDGCGALQILRLSANLTSMGSYSLQNTPLEYIKVPSQVEVLSQGVLRNCKNLESLSLPSSLKTVEGEALYGCTSLRNLSIEAIEPPVIKDKSAIRGINTDLCLISIPTQSYRKYVLAEYWGQFVQMRNDIAVETEGNGEIAFESVNDDEEDEEDEVSETREFDLGTGAARVRRRVAELATEDEESMAIVNNGSTIYVPQQGKVRFYIIPAEGEELISATLDGEDIMPYIVDGVYTATADKRNAKLVVVFSGDSQGGSAGLMGDVNGDGTVSVTDVGCVINYILEQVPEPFITAAADMNSDGSISVTDVGYIINYILNDGAACRAEQLAAYSYDVPMLMPDTDGYVLTMDGADAFIGFQMDIIVPESANGCSVQLKNTGTSHQLACRQLSRGHYRVVCYSPVNETFPKGLTDLLTFATESDMSISDIRFTTEGLDEVRFDDMNATPTSIASVTDLKAADIRVYTLDGQLCRIVRAKSGENPLKDLQPGIYLINDRKYIVR